MLFRSLNLLENLERNALCVQRKRKREAGDTGSGNQDCHRYNLAGRESTPIRWNGRTARMRVIKLHDSQMGDTTDYVGRVRDLARDVGRAMDEMQAVSLNEATVLLSERTDPPTPGEYAHAWGRDGECTVKIGRAHV